MTDAIVQRFTFRTMGVLVLVLLALAACSAPQATSQTDVAPATEGDAISEPVPNADGYVDITVEQLAGMLSENDLTLVNVHVPYQGELPDTDLFIPYNEIRAHTDSLPAKDAPVVLYCRSGSMSTQAAKELAALGYTNVFELDGGFNAWRAAGYELLNNK